MRMVEKEKLIFEKDSDVFAAAVRIPWNMYNKDSVVDGMNNLRFLVGEKLTKLNPGYDVRYFVRPAFIFGEDVIELEAIIGKVRM